jgi:putative choline sulfate-utilization transcription factor
MARRPLDLGWLRLFCEVGRTGNLTVAADRLGLSQPAISYQMRRIEAQLQVSLFVRQHRGVSLTPEGRRLFDIVSRSVEDIDALAHSFRQRPTRPTIRLKADYAFSSLWLMPRVHSFRQNYPHMDFQIVAAHRAERNQPESGEVSVVFGTREELGGMGILLMPERVAPVCAPGFLATHGPYGQADRLAGATLLHLDTQGPSPWHDWTSYFHALGVTHPGQEAQGELCFNTYALVVQAAIAEQGLALGWLGLVDQLLASGMLVTAGPVLETADRGYWILPPSDDVAGADELRQWLLAQFQPAASAAG